MSNPFVFLCEDCDNDWPHLHILPMEEVLDYDSCDAFGMGENAKARSVLDYKRRDEIQIECLREIIERDGFKEGYGIAIRFGERWVHDGHHRLTVLYDMGAKWCPVQSRARHGQDTDDYRSSKANRYRNRYDEPAWSLELNY